MALAIPVLAQAASNPVLAAVKRTATAKSSTFRMSMTTSVAGQRMVLSGSGAQSGSSARLSMRTSGLGGAVRMDAVLVTEHGAYVMYLRSPAFSSQLPRGKSWLRVDLSKQLSNMGVNFSALLSASQTFKPLEKGLVSTTRLDVTSWPGKRPLAIAPFSTSSEQLEPFPGIGSRLPPSSARRASHSVACGMTCGWPATGASTACATRCLSPPQAFAAGLFRR
jgi:hypothetical protein